MLERRCRVNRARSKVRAFVEHVFAAQKTHMGLYIRTIGLADLAYNFRRLTGIYTRTASA